MDYLKQNKTALLGGAAIFLAGYIYFAYFSGPSSPTLSSSDANITLSQNLLVTLQNLHTIKLDNSLFSSPAFVSLSDFGVTIPTQNVGRRNPFAPAVSGGQPAASPAITLPAKTR